MLKSQDDGESAATQSITSQSKRNTITARQPKVSKANVLEHDPLGVDARARAFVLAACLMEVLYYFVGYSLDLFLLHGLAFFTVSAGPEDIYNHVFWAKACGAALSISFGAVIDSYVRNYRFFLLLILLASLVVWPCIYFIISFPAYWFSTPAKLHIFQFAAGFHGLFCLMEPVRICTIGTAALEVLGYPKHRTFFAYMVLCQRIGIVAAALAIYLCQSSRTKYATLMVMNLVFITLYVIFWLLCVKSLLISRKTQIGVVERAVINIFCHCLKKIDQCCLRNRFFGRRSGWMNYRCIQFQENTARNAWTMVGIIGVLIPLTGYFAIAECLDYFCSLQCSNLILEKEQFALIGFKACFFVGMFPFFECLFVPQVRKIFKSKRVEHLTLLGIGAFIIAGAVVWASVIQHMILKEKDYVTGPNQPSGHVVLMNAISSLTKVRGEHLNNLMALPRNAWFSLEPYIPLKVLHVPMTSIPFGISLYNSKYGIYDDFNISFVEDNFNWFIVCPEKFVQLPVGTFHRVPEVAADPKYFSPGIVNVICRLPLCRGYLEFRKSPRHYERVYYPTPDIVKTLRLAGTYGISFAMVGNTIGVRSVTYTFHRLGIYIVTILPPAGEHVGAAVSLYASVRIVPTNAPPDISYAWIYPEAFFHALSELFAKASLYAWLYVSSPPELRSTMFCFTVFLSLPCYVLILHDKNPLSLQRARPITLFSVACAHGFCLIIYCCSCVYYCRRTFEDSTDESMKNREGFSEGEEPPSMSENENNKKKRA